MDDWDPEKEQDPDKVQAEMLALGKEMLENLKRDAERKKQEEEALRKDLEMSGQSQSMVGAYHLPTFEEVSARIQRAWAETKKIAPDADGTVQVEILRMLLQAAWTGEQAI